MLLRKPVVRLGFADILISRRELWVYNRKKHIFWFPEQRGEPTHQGQRLKVERHGKSIGLEFEYQSWPLLHQLPGFQHQPQDKWREEELWDLSNLSGKDAQIVVFQASALWLWYNPDINRLAVENRIHGQQFFLRPILVLFRDSIQFWCY